MISTDFIVEEYWRVEANIFAKSTYLEFITK